MKLEVIVDVCLYVLIFVIVVYYYVKDQFDY